MAGTFPIAKFVDVFDAIYQELVQIAFDWRKFMELFGDHDLVAEMNQTAQGFFWELQKMLAESLTLRVCRITDPETTGKFQNLGFSLLVAELHRNGSIDDVQNQQWQTILAEIHSRVEPLRLLRNKRLAHNDAISLINKEQIPAQFKDLRLSIESVNSLFNSIEHKFGLPRTNFSEAILSLQNVSGLKGLLRDAIELRSFMDVIGGRQNWPEFRKQFQRHDGQ